MARTGFQTKRLKKWAASLSALRPTRTKQFDMGAFRYELYKNGTDILGFTNNVDDAGNPLEKSCGFAACAVGWLPTFFPRNFKVADVLDQEAGRRDIQEQVSGFFGLTDHEYSMIVYPENYEGMTDNITPKHAAARVKEVLKGEYRNDCDCCDHDDDY